VHAKNILIDNKQLYIWSMNLSTNAIEQNREIGVVTTDTWVVNTFLKQFQEDRETKATSYQN
jgi:phosphatidylserine/phosphatidylglycerophosphate/cardiolipin synthase-like enzyme